MTPFALLVSLAGLSHREAAAFHRVRLDTIRSVSTGRRSRASDGMITELRRLIAAQERAAAENIAVIAARLTAAEAAGQPLDAVVIGFPSDDHEAQALGFPCVGAWQAMAARVVAWSPVPVRLVARGADLATAGASAAHGK